MQYTRYNILFSPLEQFCQFGTQRFDHQGSGHSSPILTWEVLMLEDCFYLQRTLEKVTPSMYDRGIIFLCRTPSQKTMIITLNCNWILTGSLVFVVSFRCSQMTTTKSNWKAHFTSQAPTQFLCLIPFNCPGSPPSCCKRSHCELKDR